MTPRIYHGKTKKQGQRFAKGPEVPGAELVDYRDFSNDLVTIAICYQPRECHRRFASHAAAEGGPCDLVAAPDLMHGRRTVTWCRCSDNVIAWNWMSAVSGVRKYNNQFANVYPGEMGVC